MAQVNENEAGDVYSEVRETNQGTSVSGDSDDPVEPDTFPVDEDASREVQPSTPPDSSRDGDSPVSRSPLLSDASTGTPLSQTKVSHLGEIPAQVLDEIRKVVKKEVHEARKQELSISHPDGTVSSTELARLPLLQKQVDDLATSYRPKPIPLEEKPRSRVRFSDIELPRNSTRLPGAFRRSSVSLEPSADWGVLFDEGGYATHRCGQVLRGLARYMIDEFTPKGSLVVTPEKLGTLYSRFRLDEEVIPFVDIFQPGTSTAAAKTAHHASLSDFYADLGCQQHLVQADARSKPAVPALTPVGFAQFYLTCVLAHPDAEARRLSRIAHALPLRADGPGPGPEPRPLPLPLPRAFARALAPPRHDAESRKLLAAAVDDLLFELRYPGGGGRPPRSASSSGALPDLRRFPHHTPPHRTPTAEAPPPPSPFPSSTTTPQHQHRTSTSRRRSYAPAFSLETISDEDSGEQQQQQQQQPPAAAVTETRRRVNSVAGHEAYFAAGQHEASPSSSSSYLAGIPPPPIGRNYAPAEAGKEERGGMGARSLSSGQLTGGERRYQHHRRRSSGGGGGGGGGGMTTPTEEGEDRGPTWDEVLRARKRGGGY
ncbi:hypothetical protein F4780DRAFT_797626 [Xylariomycetidae sp. FL0641]|nr:hypothetical protein F4780DRAFT_797626 [Xylariomycetidae sp. FL0641]